MKGFIRGIKAYFGAFKIISDLKLWKYYAVPMLVSLGIAIVIFLISYGFSDNLGTYLSSLWTWESGKEIFDSVSQMIAASIIITFGFLSFKYIVLGVSAPFMAPISKKIENHFIGEGVSSLESSSWKLLVRGIRISLRNIIREFILTIPILLLGLIPLIGIFSAVLLFLMQAYFAGFGNMDYTLERHFDYKNSVRFVKRNRGLATGNGVIFMLFLLIPIIGVILVLPLSVTASTIETVKEIQNEKKK